MRFIRSWEKRRACIAYFYVVGNAVVIICHITLGVVAFIDISYDKEV